MSDCCFSRGWCRPQDVPFFEELGYEVDDEKPDDAPRVRVVDDLANYGNYGQLTEDVDRFPDGERPIFIIENDGGDEYAPCTICCDGGETVTIETDDTHKPIVTVPESGQIDERDLAAVMNFWKVYRRSATILGFRDGTMKPPGVRR